MSEICGRCHEPVADDEVFCGNCRQGTTSSLQVAVTDAGEASRRTLPQPANFSLPSPPPAIDERIRRRFGGFATILRSVRPATKARLAILRGLRASRRRLNSA